MAHSRIYLIGFMGAGKSSVGRRLAKRLGWKFIDLDEEIERRERCQVSEIFRDKGETYFRNLERRCLRDLSTSASNSVIALGGGAYIDPQNRDVAEKTGLTVWLKVSFEKLATRVKIDGTRPKFADPEQAQKLFETRAPSYALAKLHISTDEGSPDSVADEIAGVIRNS